MNWNNWRNRAINTLNDQFKIKSWAPKFNKKMVEIMRKNHFKADNQTHFSEYKVLDFTKQQTLMKNEISKKYQIELVTSFNERTIFAVVGKNEDGEYFYAIDKNVQDEISVEQLKTLV